MTLLHLMIKIDNYLPGDPLVTLGWPVEDEVKNGHSTLLSQQNLLLWKINKSKEASLLLLMKVEQLKLLFLCHQV